jgi:uncharacterized surface protein with fasciclin (FAS1) repeats
MSQAKVQRTIIATILGLFTAAVLSFVAVMPASAGKPSAAAAAKPGTSTIKDIVVSNGNFDVLEAAVVKAGLAGVLDGNRQFTVFAPTDQAFINSLGVVDEAAAIAAVEELPEGALTNILLYHVTGGRKISTAVLASPSQQMLNGDKLPISEVVAAGPSLLDQSASNGVIHIINDGILMPME